MTNRDNTTDTVPVDNFDEVGEAWRCPHMSVDTGGPGDEHFRAGTVIRLDGAEHRERRRAMNGLLSRGGHQYFRQMALIPTLDAAMTELLSRPDPDGYSRVQLVPFARRVSQQLAAALTGYDRATTPEGAEELEVLLDDWIRGKQSAFDNAFAEFDEETEASRAGLRAIELIRDRFYRPAFERREELLAAVEAGELSQDDLPSDLLMLMAQRLDPRWEDPGLRQRESVFVLGAGVRTSTFSLIWALEELFEWLERHPEDRALIDDESFLLGVVNESLRLHPVTPGFVRRATQDVTLQRGTHVDEGQLIVIHNGPAGVDREVFGPDANEFNPHRVVPKGTNPHAYAFGAGPHLCFGARIVMGHDGLDGSMLHFLRVLLRAGVEPDPGRPRISLEGTRGVFDHGGDDFCYVRFRVPT